MARHRWIVALFALALLGAACSSESADEGGGDDGGADTGTAIDGITDDTINISFIGADFAALAEAGLAPDLGDMEITIPALVDDINENGGIGGRQVELTVDLVDGTGGPDVGRAACIKATEEDDAAVVIISPAISREIVRCTDGPTAHDHPRHARLGRPPLRGGRGTALQRRRPRPPWGPTATPRCGPTCSTRPASSRARRSAW